MGINRRHYCQTCGDYPCVSEENDPTTGYANARRLTLALAGFVVFEYDEEGAHVVLAYKGRIVAK